MRTIIVALVAIAVGTIYYNHQYRIQVAWRAFRTLWTLPPDVVAAFEESYAMYDKPYIVDNGRHVAAWYAVLNQFLTLGDLTRMYIPPVLDKTASLEHNQDLMEERMARDFGARPGMRVLDIGCGRGRIAQHMAQYGKFHVTGVNIDKTQIAEATANAAHLNLSHTLSFQVHDYNQPFPFPDNYFDAIYEVGAIMYVKNGDFVPVFKEVKRMLKPGGVVAFNDWATLKDYNPENATHKEIMRQVREVSGWVYLAKSDEMANAMKEAGLQVQYSGTFTDHGHTYEYFERVDGYFHFVAWLFKVLDRFHIIPHHLAHIFERMTRGGDAVVLADKMKLFTAEWYAVGKKM